MAFHWALSWKCSQPCIPPFYFFHFLLARSMCLCLVVTGFAMFCAVRGWLGGCVSCLFCLQGFRACRIPFKIISHLGEIPRNGMPLGSFLGVFPALHFSFLFLQSSFQQEACVYVWLSLVLSCFVHFLCWLGGCAKWHSTGLSPGSVPSLAFFLSISSIFFSTRNMYLCFVGCGLWDSAWQMANLPDRSKCINYHKILWFWNAMIYLH